MMNKQILLAAVAAVALTAAGSASALNLSGSKVGSQQVISGTTVSPYYLESHLKATGGLTGTVTISATTTTGPLTTGQFLVTYTISGASFDTPAQTINATNLHFVGTASNTNAILQSASASSVSFVVSVGGGDSLTSVEFAAPVKMTTVGDASIGASLALATNPDLAIDSGPAATTQIITTTDGFVGSIGSTPATDNIATIVSGFKQFTGGATSATIGSVKVAVRTAPTGAAGSAIFTDLSGNTSSSSSIVDGSDITGLTATFTGSVASSEKVILGSLGSSTVNVSPPVIGGNLLATAGTSYPVILDNSTATIAQISASTYSVNVTPVLSSTFNADTADSVTLGKVTYEGSNLYAAWIGDGVNGYDFRIRLGNQSGAIGKVNVTLLNPSAVVANLGPLVVKPNIGANGEVIITSANLKSVFGAFGRSDLLITVEGDTSVLSAKARVINLTTGVVTEQSLGNGVCGNTATDGPCN